MTLMFMTVDVVTAFFLSGGPFFRPSRLSIVYLIVLSPIVQNVQFPDLSVG